MKRTSKMKRSTKRSRSVKTLVPKESIVGLTPTLAPPPPAVMKQVRPTLKSLSNRITAVEDFLIEQFPSK